MGITRSAGPRRLRILIVTMVTVGPGIPSADARQLETAPVVRGPLAGSVDEYVRNAEAEGFSGAVLVERRGQVILRQGYGWADSTKLARITPETRFWFASVTKGMTAAAILRLQETGSLSVDRPLSEFLEIGDSPFGDATLHQLMTHTAGVPNEYVAEGVGDRDEAVRLIVDSPPAFGIGTDFLYSNSGYNLLAAVIDRVADRGYDRYLRDLLRDEAGMETAVFWGMVDDRDPAVFAQKQFERSPANRRASWGGRGSGNVGGSVVDLHRWARAVIHGNLLSPVSRGALFGPHRTLGSGTGIGYGWFTSPTPGGGQERWSRGGEGFGHNAVIRWFPSEELLILVVSNAGVFRGNEANRTVSDGIRAITLGGVP